MDTTNGKPRVLGESLSFSLDPFAGVSDLKLCWPEHGDRLLRAPVDAEVHVYPLTEWVPNDLERLTYYAIQYHEMATELTKLWLQHNRRQPGNWIYVIGFLYRHVVELRLKAAIVRTRRFHELNAVEQRETIWRTHSLHKLWNFLEPALPDGCAADVSMIRDLLLQLHEIDHASDGFRYPFRVEVDGSRVDVAASLSSVGPANPSYVSADNFIWVLEGLCNWLNAIEDVRQQEDDARRVVY